MFYLYRFLKGLGDALEGVRRWIEARTLIPLIEGLVRGWYHLDPRVYFETARIKAVTEGNLGRKSNAYVIFVLYARSPLPAFTRNLLDAIDRSALNLIVVSNTALDPYLKAQLLDKSYLLIERANLGRDFGAYRDGVSVLLRHTKDVDRLVLLNDSLFFFDRGLDQFIARLSGDQEFIGVTEVFEFHYHVQSYALSFGRHVVNSKEFRRFWRRYRPISSRRWSIHNGEVKLTRRLTKAGFRPHILYQAAELVPHLQTRSVRELLESVCLLPTAVREKLYLEFDSILGGEGHPDSIAAIEAIAHGVRTFGNRPGAARGEGALQKIMAQAESMERWSFEIFVNRIVAAIAAHNQVHAGGFLFARYLGLPVIKRDIFYRQVYTLEDIHRIIGELARPLRDEMMADLRRAGTSANFRGLRKLLHYHGSI